MGRIRTIKPEIIEDEDTAGLSHEAFRLFIGCLALADDYGNLRGQPRWLSCQVFWATPGNADRAILELAEAKLVVLYEVEGEVYLHIKGWSKHQRVDKPGKPRVPAFSEEFAKSQRNLATDLRPPTSDLDLRPPTSDLPPMSPSAPLATLSRDELAGDVSRVIEHYRSLHPRARPGDAERKKIRARLKEGYSPEDLCRAIDGQHATPHNQGHNDRGQTYLSLELAMRDSSHVARYIEATNGPRRIPSAKERQRLEEVQGALEILRSQDAAMGRAR